MRIGRGLGVFTGILYLSTCPRLTTARLTRIFSPSAPQRSTLTIVALTFPFTGNPHARTIQADVANVRTYVERGIARMDCPLQVYAGRTAVDYVPMAQGTDGPESARARRARDGTR